jgi:hypothetical protein
LSVDRMLDMIFGPRQTATTTTKKEVTE